MEETIRFRVDAIRCWHEERARTIITGSFLGSLVLTTQRLVFISCGSNGIAGRFKALIRGFVEGFPYAYVRAGHARTKDLSLCDMSNEGSFQVPLERIAACEPTIRWDRSPYLKVRFHDEVGNTIHRSFMTEAGLDMQEVKDIEAAIGKAKAGQNA